VKRLGEIYVKEILEIKKRVLGFVEKLERGMLRRKKVYVGGKVKKGNNEIKFIMKEFEKWMNYESVVNINKIRYEELEN
jgi:hypothetical protein